MGVYNINGASLLKPSGMHDVIRVAASNSNPGEKEIADYVCDGVNDEVELQAAINRFIGKSGVVKLSNGTYIIDSFTNHDSTYYGLYIPYQEEQIIICGTNQNNRSLATSASFTAVDASAVIKVSSQCYNNLSSSSESIVIGTKREKVFPYNNFSLRNVGIDIPNNLKPIVGVDMGYSYRGDITGCYFTTHGEGDKNNVSTNANPKCISVRFGVTSCVGFNNYLEHNKSVGWGTGYQILGEHIVLNDCLSQRNQYGFVFGNIAALNNMGNTGTHPNILIGCCAEFNKKAALMFGVGANNIEIIGLDMEVATAESELYPQWAPKSTFEAWVPEAIFTSEDTGWGGRISFSLKTPGGGTPSNYNPWDTNAHAAEFDTVDLTARKSGTTAQRPVRPCYMSTYFDTTLNKLLVYNGFEWI